MSYYAETKTTEYDMYRDSIDIYTLSRFSARRARDEFVTNVAGARAIDSATARADYKNQFKYWKDAKTEDVVLTI